MRYSIIKYLVELRPPELVLFIKYILRIKRFELSVDDNRRYLIDPVSNLGFKLLNNGTYEPEMTDTIKTILKEDDTFIDVGSNEGFFSVLGSKLCGDKGKVYAIEPQKRLWNVIIMNSLLNNCMNIQVIPFGLGSSDKETYINLYSSLNTGASTYSSFYNFTISFKRIRRLLYGRQKSKTIKLDNFENVFPTKIKLLKIDIEGFEFEALRGSKRLLLNRAFENILVEFHPEVLSTLGQSEADIHQYLEEFGYSKKYITDNLYLYSFL